MVLVLEKNIKVMIFLDSFKLKNVTMHTHSPCTRWVLRQEDYELKIP